jgi:zinc protease
MANARFDPQEFESERTVIISEREGAENQPSYLLNEEVEATAFREHPYRWSVVGWKDDLRAMTRDQLHGYYRTHYAPNNAFLVVAGDFERKPLLERLRELYGGIPGGDGPPPVDAVEPPQRAERRVILRQRGGAAIVRVACHAPPVAHDDCDPLLVAATLLSGASGMGMGGSVGGRTSRLYRALVRAELASGAYASFRPSIDPHLFSVGATVREGVDVPRVEAALGKQLDRLASEPVPDAELGKAQTQIRAAFAYAWDGVTNMGAVAGSMEAVDSFRRLETLLDRIAAVNAADVQRVARTWLGPANRTVGIFLPTNRAAPAAS